MNHYYLITKRIGCMHYFFYHYNTNDFTKEEFELIIQLYFKENFQLQKSNTEFERSKDIMKCIPPSFVAENKEKINKQTLNKLINLWKEEEKEKFAEIFAYDIETIKKFIALEKKMIYNNM